MLDLGLCVLYHSLPCLSISGADRIRHRLTVFSRGHSPEHKNTHLIEEMSPELIEQAKACKTLEEGLAFISAHHIELSPEQMDAISGGTQERNEKAIYKAEENRSEAIRHGTGIRATRHSP